MVKNRHKILLGVILLLIAWILILHFLPVGTGNWNEKQIKKIGSTETSDEFCFAVMGDNKNGFHTFNQILEDVENRSPLFAIDVGDIVYDGEKEKYRIFYDIINGLKVPFLVVIGNHELIDGGRDDYFKIFGDFYYSFNYSNSLFIVLDDANEEYIKPEQIEFLESELKKDFAHKFVFLHVPPFDPRRYVLDTQEIVRKDMKAEHALSDKENAKQFMDLVNKYDVTTVFTSHIHGYFNESYGNTSYIITGGAGGEIRPSDPEHYFYHYINVCVNGKNVDYEVIRFPSPDPNRIDRFSHTIWLYIWYFVVTHRNELLSLVLILTLVFDLSYKPLKELVRILKTILKKDNKFFQRSLNSIKKAGTFLARICSLILNKTIRFYRFVRRKS